MLDSSKTVSGLAPEAPPNVETKAKEQHETLDNLIKQTLTSDSFLSFSKAEKSSVQWLHLLDTLDQQNMNQDFSSSKLEVVSNARGQGQEDIENDSKAEESLVSKNCTVKGGSLFGRGLQNTGDKFSSLKLPEAMAAIAQAAKDIPGWPLMSSKVTMLKCEKCSQEFSSPLNQRRHMRATHRRPLKGDKEDLKKKKEQVGAFWDKLTAEESRERLSSNNLSLGDLSATSLVQALSTQLQQPGLPSLPQSYTKVATFLLDIVQGEPLRYPLTSRELFAILEEASEDNLLYGVTSSSMQRCMFGSDPGRVGLETKNLVSSLGFLVELRLVQAWMDDKDAEALRCQNALVEEEEAALKKRAKLQERKRQKKMRQRESKDKDKKALDPSVSVQGLSIDFLSHNEEDSPTTSTPSNGFLGRETSLNNTTVTDFADTQGVNHSAFPSSFVEDEQLGYLDFEEECESQITFWDQKGGRVRACTQFRLTNEYSLAGEQNWKERRNGDYAHSWSHSRYGASHDRRGFEHQVGDHWMRKSYSINGNSSQELLKANASKYHEKFSVMKRPISMTGNIHAVWTRKVLQNFDASLHDDNVDTTASEMGKDLKGKLEENTLLSNAVKPIEQNGDSSLSLDSIVSQSICSLSARIGFNNEEDREGLSLTSEAVVEGKAGIKALVIGSVMIPYGEAELVSELEDIYQLDEGDVKCDELSSKGLAVMGLDGAQQWTKSALLDTVREMPLSWKDAPPYQPLSEMCNKQSKGLSPALLSKPSLLKIGRSNCEHNDSIVAPSTGSKLDQGVTIVPMVSREDGNEYAETYAPMHSQPSKFSAGNRLGGNFNTRLENLEKQVLPSVQAAALKGDIASLLHQRWEDATLSSDVVYHQDLD